MSVNKHEFWSTRKLYGRFWVRYLFHALRLRDPVFFTRLNPGIPYGGMLQYSKFDLQAQLPEDYRPNHFLFRQGEYWSEKGENWIAKVGYPFVAKPDVGLRGYGVKTIKNDGEFKSLFPLRFPLLVQELVEEEMEFGVFYVRFPSGEDRITGITGKVFLHVLGDGKSSLCELVHSNNRAVGRLDYLREVHKEDWSTIIPSGQKFVLEPIGNHNRGTVFLDRSELISERVLSAFREITKHIEGFYWGRLDVKVQSEEDLSRPGRIRVLEVNGALSEPTHIYDPEMRTEEALEVISTHLDLAYQMVKETKGIPKLALPTFFKAYMAHKKFVEDV